MKPHESDFVHICLGSFGAIVSADYGHAVIALFVGLSTGIYMSLRGIREYVKLKHDLKNGQNTQPKNPNEEN